MTPKERDSAINALVAMKGHVRKLKKEGAIDDQDKALFLARIKKIGKVLEKL